MGGGPAPFSDIGKRTRDLLTRDYCYVQRISISIPNATGMGITASGIKKNDIFFGDIRTKFVNGNATVDVKVDTHSNISTKVTVDNILSSTKAAVSFNIPDHKSGKLEVHYFHPHATVNSSIGLNPLPHLDLSGTLGTKDLSLGGEIGFDTSSSSFTKYNAGISFNQKDFSAALILTDKGRVLKASYVHSLNNPNIKEVGAEIIHRFSNFENSFSIGSLHRIDRYTSVKTRISDNGQIAMLWQKEWRPKSLVTFSAEYDSKVSHKSPKLGLSLALKT